MDTIDEKDLEKMGTPDFRMAFCIKVFQTKKKLLDFQPIQNRVDVTKRINHTTVTMAFSTPARK